MAKKFEYKVCRGNEIDSYGEKLKKIGEEGWELVGIRSAPGKDDSNFYFKREIDPPITQKQERNGYDISR